MTIDEYNRKLAEMQTQMKELVPDPFVDRYLDDALEKFGKKWYSRGYEDAKSEIVHCKDCRYWPYKSMPYSSYEKYTEHYPQCFDAKSNDYCYLAKRKENDR